MTDDNNQDPPKPKRRRKPPEGFDTGYPEDAIDPPSEPVSTGVPKKQLWGESKPSEPTAASRPVDPATSKPVDPAASNPVESRPVTSRPLEPKPAASSLLARVAEAIPVPTPPSATVPVETGAIESSHPAATSLGYPALQRESIASTPVPVPIPASASGWASESGPTSPSSSASSAATSAAIPTSGSGQTSGPTSGVTSASASGPTSSADPAWPTSSSDPSSTSLASTSGVVTAPELHRASGALAMEPLPASLSVGTTDLRDAVGARPERRVRARTPVPDLPDDSDDEDLADGGGKRRSRKMILVSVTSLVVGLGVAALVFLGRANSSYYYISCEPDRIVAQQGRAFPPWGESTLEGKQWTPIKIPPEAECIALETEDEAQLSDQFRTMLVKRASVLLTAREVTKTDEANALLEQALLHARASTDAARNARTEIQRLLGDVVYWRASLKMRDASKALLEAAKQFDTAAQQRPRHVTDAAAWAEYVRKVVGELEAGPAGTTQMTFPPAPPPTEDRPPAPPGVALPVEPDQGSAAEPPAAPPPDAALPTGGVLL